MISSMTTGQRRTRHLLATLLASGIACALPNTPHAQTAPNATPACTGDDAAETTQCGTEASASAPLSTAVGRRALASGEESTAIGWQSSATGINATAVGGEASAVGFVSDAFGTGAFAQGAETLAVGHQAWAAGQGSVAAGVVSYAEGAAGVAIGRFADSRGTESVVVGGSSAFDVLTGEGSSPTVGTLGSYAYGNGATVIGGQARAGYLANTSPVDVVPTTAADGGTAIGFQAVVEQARGTALGANAHAVQAGATAIGAGAVTTAANQVALGGTGSSVRVGDVAASTAAQTGATAVMTVDARGTVGADTTIRPAIAALQTGQAMQANLVTTLQTGQTTQAGQITALQGGQTTQASQITALQSGQTAMTGRINTLFDLADVNRRDIRKANEGVAMALAMETPALPAGARVGIAGGFGYYNNRVAGTASFAVRIGDRSAFSGGIGVGMNTGEVGARAGLQAAW